MSQPIADATLPKPITDDEVRLAISKLSKLNAKDINAFCEGYVNRLKKIIQTVKKSLNPNEDEDDLVEIERLMRLINMLPKDEIFIRSKEKIWFVRYHILNRNADWFLNRDYSSSVKKDEKQLFIQALIQLVKSRWKTLTNTEQEIYWENAFEILNIVAKFKKLTGEE